MKYNKGDKIVCTKTTYNVYSKEIWTKNKKYTITNIKERIFKYQDTYTLTITQNEIYKRPTTITEFVFNKYFITEKQFRKLKLEKLLNLTTEEKLNMYTQ